MTKEQKRKLKIQFWNWLRMNNLSLKQWIDIKSKEDKKFTYNAFDSWLNHYTLKNSKFESAVIQELTKTQ